MKNDEEKIVKDNKLQYKISLIILVLAIVLVGVIGTYAFFQATGTSTDEQVSVTAGTMELIFSDGNNGFEKALEFGGSASKTFTIKNNGSIDAVAKINWKNLVNTYLDESLTYSLSYTTEEDDTPKPVITDKNVPRSTEPATVLLANGLSIPSGKTYTFTLTITLNYLESTDQTADLKARLSTEFSIEEGSRYLVNTLLSKANDSSKTDYNTVSNKGEMYTFTHVAATQTTGWTDEERTDYRYIGATPNNYINFNNETWRIIGVFTVEEENNTKEQRVKIIREESIGNLAWDSGNVNEWPTSTLSKLLNTGDYYKRSGSYASTGLTDTAKKQISPVKWYLGGGGTNGNNQNGAFYYNFERGETVYSGRSTNTIANVGLMYPSDYVYTYGYGVNDKCYNDAYNCNNGTPSAGWLYSSLSTSTEWTISHYAEIYWFAVARDSYGTVYVNSDSNYPHASRPVVYLRSDIEIIEGDGVSVETAYQLNPGQF